MNSEENNNLIEITRILEEHLLIQKNLLVHKPLSLEERQFIANNIPSHCFYEGKAYRIFFNVDEPLEGPENNCSWSSSKEGLDRFYKNSNTSDVNNYIIKEADIYGIDINLLVEFLSKELPHFSISQVVLNESEILSLELFNWNDSDYVLNL